MMLEVNLPEPADISRPYSFDSSRLRADMESVSDGMDGVPGVQLIDPNVEKIADIVSSRLRADMESVSDGMDGVPGVQLIDPNVEKIADIVSAAVGAAVAAQSARGATEDSVRIAARSAVTEAME